MGIPEIIALTVLALAIRFSGERWRGWLIFVTSVLAVFWLQPALSARWLDFWLPVGTLALAVLAWILTSPPENRYHRENRTAGVLLLILVLFAAATRYVGAGDWLTASRPPPLAAAAAGAAAAAVLAAALWLAVRGKVSPRWALNAAVVVFIVLLVVLKTPLLALASARGYRAFVGQNPSLGSAFDIRWLGFSYLAFRLIHTLRDRLTGRLPAASLKTYLSYAAFFPAFVAGPIDRLERFQKDFCAVPAEDREERRTALENDLSEAGRRLVIGLFKKFAVADTLALVALNGQNADQVQSAGWLWLLVYVYAFQIYFDFSGYTDVAIGLGRILGIRLPENFLAPYAKPNLTLFWNSWHMSLTLWFRSYFFNPFVRWLRGQQTTPALTMLTAQAATFLLIGLWHGVTWNFAVWGIWHGIGLFVQNRWTETTRGWWAHRQLSPLVGKGLYGLGVLLTFHYVALGWVWFALPNIDQAGSVMLRLFGMR